MSGFSIRKARIAGSRKEVLVLFGHRHSLTVSWLSAAMDIVCLVYPE